MQSLTILLVSILNIICFVLGAKISRGVDKTVDKPKNAEVKKLFSPRKSREQEAQEAVYATLLKNIDAYDGTSTGQSELPRGYKF